MARPATGQVVPPDEKRRSWSLRVRAYGKRHRVLLAGDDWTHSKAEAELRLVLAQIELGRWQPPEPKRIAVAGPPATEPTFHEFASDWYEGKQRELRPNTARNYRSDLSLHLLPFFAEHRLSQITVAEVDRYRQLRVRQGKLKARTINMHLALLAQILDVALDHDYIARNPASGRRRRLKVDKPRPVFLDTAEQMVAMLDAASALDGAANGTGSGQTTGRRACIAALLFGGLRAEEVGAMLWRDVDLANGRMVVGRAKTDAGMREVDLLPILLDELATLKARAGDTAGPNARVFVTSSGKPRDRHNVRQRVVAPVVKKADELLAERDLNPLPAGVTPHKLRHSFCSLLVALGRDPATVMQQMGHTDPAFTLRVYTHMMRRDQAERDRLRALVEGADWAHLGPQPVAAAA